MVKVQNVGYFLGLVKLKKKIVVLEILIFLGGER